MSIGEAFGKAFEASMLSSIIILSSLIMSGLTVLASLGWLVYYLYKHISITWI